MTETSKGFHSLTGERSFLDDVTVVLPDSWANTECALKHVDPDTPAPMRESADIHVTGERHPTFGSRPWTRQYGQCGQTGQFLELPYSGLTANQTLHKETVDSMIKEWIKLRFGVFEENGFDGDQLYPATFTEAESTFANRGCNKTDSVSF